MAAARRLTLAGLYLVAFVITWCVPISMMPVIAVAVAVAVRGVTRSRVGTGGVIIVREAATVRVVEVIAIRA